MIPRYPGRRALLAGAALLHRPLTGVVTGGGGGASYTGPGFHDFGGFDGQAKDTTVQVLCGLALADDSDGAAAYDHPESTAILAYDLIRARISTAPYTVSDGNTFSRPALNKWWPKHAIVPASKVS